MVCSAVLQGNSAHRLQLAEGGLGLRHSGQGLSAKGHVDTGPCHLITQARLSMSSRQLPFTGSRGRASLAHQAHTSVLARAESWCGQIDEDERLVLIDFPQMVSSSHANAAHLFQRDAECVNRCCTTLLSESSASPSCTCQDRGLTLAVALGRPPASLSPAHVHEHSCCWVRLMPDHSKPCLLIASVSQEERKLGCCQIAAAGCCQLLRMGHKCLCLGVLCCCCNTV